jgi:hypothetical protein
MRDQVRTGAVTFSLALESRAIHSARGGADARPRASLN